MPVMRPPIYDGPRGSAPHPVPGAAPLPLMPDRVCCPPDRPGLPLDLSGFCCPPCE